MANKTNFNSIFVFILTITSVCAFVNYNKFSHFPYKSQLVMANSDVKQSKVLFVETGFGCDQHGQSSTKAAVRACRNAIEFNSLPAMEELIPGGKKNMILRVQIAVPFPETVNKDEIYKVFPYGKVIPEIIDGGLKANSGCVLPAMGDKNDDMLIAVAAVYVGY